MSILSSKIKLLKNYDPSPVPRSYNEPRLPYADGVRKDLLNYAIAPKDTEYKTKLDTNNYLPPPPRNQLAADPANFMISRKPYDKIYNKYFLSTQNGISGIVQAQINNANYARGNQFAANEAVKRLNYTAEFPMVQTPKKDIIITNSPYYPYPNYKLTMDRNYRTYNHPKRYVSGEPIIELFDNKEVEEIFKKGSIVTITLLIVAGLCYYYKK